MIRTTTMRLACVATMAAWVAGVSAWAVAAIKLNDAVVVVRSGDLPKAEQAAAVALVEEIEKRTGITLPVTTEWPEHRAVIAVACAQGIDGQGLLPVLRPEGYRLLLEAQSTPVIRVIGADPRGILYGVGALLRTLDWSPGQLAVSGELDVVSSPAHAMRGHQVGYRALANSWDAWTIEQFDQYIRELALFGVNSIENIPFQDANVNPLMKYSRRDMNRAMSAICDRYDLDYWVFAPADFDLLDTELRADLLDRFEEMFQDCLRMDGVFFPGGDPGDNPPELALPFMAAIAERLLPRHPHARIWLSLLGFSETQVDYVFDYIESEAPSWFGGLVADTSGPPIFSLRNRLPRIYGLRLYPDITHNKLSQFEVCWWDPAYSVTLGREAINPRPVEFAEIFNCFAPSGDGFITYSDGVHDDVNKAVWSMRGWNPDLSPRDMLVQYTRLFFGPQVAEAAADAILALEKNWQGPLATNGAVEGTLMMWQRLEEAAPRLATNWRWQMNLLRAYYDAYTRRRLLYETRLEEEANALLAAAPEIGATEAMEAALKVLNQADTHPCHPELRAHIEQLCADLFESIGLQTSVERYHAADGERGAILDYVDFPLNNRWWLADEFEKVAALPTEDERLQRLHLLRTWENPGAGSFYDDVGNIAKSPRVRRRGASNTDPEKRAIPSPTFWWWGDGMDPRARLSWQWTMNWPEAVEYEGLDPKGRYTVRMSGQGEFLLRINGKRIPGDGERVEMGAFKEVSVPSEALESGRLVLTWDTPDEAELNWRQHSRIAEVWLLKENAQ